MEYKRIMHDEMVKTSTKRMEVSRFRTRSRGVVILNLTGQTGGSWRGPLRTSGTGVCELACLAGSIA